MARRAVRIGGGRRGQRLPRSAEYRQGLGRLGRRRVHRPPPDDRVLDRGVALRSPRPPPDDDGAVLKDPTGAGPNLTLAKISERPTPESRWHLDLYSSDPEREVERLLGLGATLELPAEAGHDFVTLADPEGNLFDVIDKRGWSFGRRV
jgi:hypothetical protein